MREIRGEVNAYASAILARLLTIVHEVPGAGRDDLQRIEREIRQMLTFVDPTVAASIDSMPDAPRFSSETKAPSSQADVAAGPAVIERLEALIGQLEQTDLQGEASNEILRDQRMALFALRDDLSTQHDATTQALQTLTSTTRSLHYTITALSARSEKITDLSGIAREELRVGVWKYALIAGISGGTVVAAVVAFINLVV